MIDREEYFNLTDSEFNGVKRDAEAGKADAQNLMGNIYTNSMMVEQDLAEAARWFEKASLRGNLDAMRSLAKMYKDGVGVPHRPNMAAVLKIVHEKLSAQQATAS